MKYMSLKNMTDEEKNQRKRKQKNEAQKRYYRKNKDYYKNYNKEHNFYKDKCVILQSKIDKVIELIKENKDQVDWLHMPAWELENVLKEDK